MFGWIAGIYGALLSVMNTMNGRLAAAYGNWGATVLIHILGLACVLPFAFTWGRRREKAPWYLYGGGLIGVVTVMFVNGAIGVLGVTMNLVLMLLGQVISSAVLDHFGWLEVPLHRMNRMKGLAILVIAAGCFLMVVWSGNEGAAPGGSPWAVAVSLASGVTMVLARLSNARLGQRAGVGYSTVMNYVTGLAGSLILFALVANFRLTAPLPAPGVPWWVYFGGPLGMVGIILINLATPKLPSVQLSVIIFLGQITSGMVIDFFSGLFSPGMLVGSLLVGLGLYLNILSDRRG